MKLKEDLRLPGVYFLAPEPPQPALLPPLDTAAFVGFAERGPLNLPVAVEDPGAFAAVFGGDLPLAVERHSRQELLGSPPGGGAGLSPRSGQTVYANLPRCVQAFFANGGRRCYVVRVAGARAQSARFALPGMVALGTAASPALLAGVAASSPGAWANRVRLSTRLQSTPLAGGGFTWLNLPGGPVLSTRAERLGRAGKPLVQSGDVLRLGLADGSRWLVPVLSFTPGRQPGAPAQDDLALQAGGLYPLHASLPGEMVLAASLLGLDEPLPLQSSGPLEFSDGQTALALHPADTPHIQPGSVLLLDLSSGRTVLLAVEAVEAAGTPFSPPLSPPVQILRAVGSGLLQIAPASAPAAPVNLVSVEVLRFDLLPRTSDQQFAPAANLSFNLGGTRFWGDVVLAETATRRAVQGQGRATEPAAAAAWYRRVNWDAFGLAPAGLTDPPDPPGDPPNDPLSALSGLLAPLGADSGLPYAARTADPRAAYEALLAQPNLTYLPLGMPGFFQENDPRQFRGPADEAPGDDDLALFDARVFSDPRLASGPSGLGETAHTLLAAAVDLHEIQGRRLYGMHSLLFIDEVALVSAPDAPHVPWQTPQALPPIPPPRPQRDPPPADCPGGMPFLACDRPPRVSSVEPYFGPIGQPTPVVIEGDGFTTSAETQVFFDRRAASLVNVISSSEIHCLAPSGLVEGAVTVRVVITSPGGETRQGELVEAFIYQASDPNLGPGALPEIDLDQPDPETPGEELLFIHHNLLTFCQARADCLAVLSLPRRYDLPRCLAWQDGLRARLGLPVLGPLGSPAFISDDLADMADLSYGAVYHPWLQSVPPGGTQPAQVQQTPPDGAVCGLVAKRERQRGVWIAPANLPLREVIGLTPAFSDDDWAVLFARRFNLLRPEPDGFRPMSAHTLSDRRSLLQISTRRLLILLRKAAVRLGMDFVFESNHERFREGARVVIEDMLRGMFQRGAFAGASPEQAFHVITDASVNPPQSVEAGRFVIVIQVAPSQPMEFITVQLTRSGEGELLTMET